MKRVHEDTISEHSEGHSDEEDDLVVGPMPSSSEVSVTVDEARSRKKRKALQFESSYLRNIPAASAYEKSFMHRDILTHVIATKTDFIITASQDGHVKFWKKLHNEGIEFVKHFRSHMGRITGMSVNSSGMLLASVSLDKTMKVFDITNFDMINMLKLEFSPLACEWIHNPADPIAAVAVSDAEAPRLVIYDGRGSSQPLTVLHKLHSKPVTHIKFNERFEAVISVDEMGMIEYWTGPKYDFAFPDNVSWKYKTDTDLFELAKCKASAISLIIAPPSGQYFAVLSSDRKIRLFRFQTGKLVKVLDESLSSYIADKEKHGLATTEFNRRMAVEKELEKSGSMRMCNMVYDESGNFIILPCLLGIKVINLKSNRCVCIIGKNETLRFMDVSLCGAIPRKGHGEQGATSVSMEMEASDNPALRRGEPDPMLVCTAYKKNRFYLFTNCEPFEMKTVDNERDVFNEKPLKEDMITAIEEESAVRRVTDSCIIHTTMGDIHCKLFPSETPKTVENFCTHARQGYYNGHIFHRVIKSFMIQTGDPTGTGTGGESIWGGDFEDEFHPSLKHDRPYTMSMANAGPNSNGSQFFITVVPTPWLDKKHTIFGRCVKGMEVVQNISKVKCNPRTDKPHDEISVISITLK